jgi:hypothetical protein
MRTYELWDGISGNLQGEFADVESALDPVRRDVEAGKGDLWRRSALIFYDEHDEETVVAEGEALIELASHNESRNGAGASATR